MGESRIRRVAGSLLVLLALWTLPACSSGSGSGQTGGAGASTASYAPLGEDASVPPWGRQPGSAAAGAAPDRGAQAQGDAPAPQAQPRGPHVRVTWEALAVEQERFENPRHGRKPTRGALITQKIVIVNESHPEAQANRLGRSMRQNQGVAVGAIADADMDLFIRGLEQRGFFRLARPTGGIQGLFDSPESRGRITVERGAESVTLLSMRGQGLDDTTKQIPAMYSQVKQAVLVLRNQTPTLSVVGARRDPLSR